MKMIILSLSTVILCSCCPVKQEGNDENIVVLSVAPYRVIGMGVGPRLCHLIREGEQGAYRLFYASIDGFDFEPGMTYKLKVEESIVENPPADGSSRRYDLVEVLEKTKEVQSLQSLQGEWKVIRLNGIQAVPKEAEQTIALDPTEMTVTGYGGSNRYRGSLVNVEGASEIGFKQIISTRRMGPHQQMEDLLFKVLARVDGYYRYDSSLLLLEGDQVIVEARTME